MIEDKNGARRSDARPFYRKIPFGFLTRLAQALTTGAVKYNEDYENSEEENWRKGSSAFARSCFDHLIEHLYKWYEGDVAEDHLGHASANLAFLTWFEEQGVWCPNRILDVEKKIDTYPRYIPKENETLEEFSKHVIEQQGSTTNTAAVPLTYKEQMFAKMRNIWSKE